MLLGSVLVATLACPAPGGARAAEATVPARTDQPARLKLAVVSRVLIEVNDRYIERSRIAPRRMALGALTAIDDAVDELVVARDARSSMVTLTIGTAVQELDLSDVRSLWDIRTFLGKAMDFLQECLPGRGDPRAIEYAAVNGMLATLDRSTYLVGPEAFKARSEQAGAAGPRVEAVPAAMLLEGDVGYARLDRFSTDASPALAAAIAAQWARAGRGLKGLILDLRGNPGGLLAQAVQVADLFLSSGVITTTVMFEPPLLRETVSRASAAVDDFLATPMVVLVDDVTAAGSEVVASALRDNDRALIVGRRTAGAGLVHVISVFPEPQTQEDMAFSLSIARLVTPMGKNIQDAGVDLDVELLPACARGAAATVDRASRPARADTSEDVHVLRLDLHDTAQPCGGGERPEVLRDAQVAFARDILARATSADRAHLRELARAYVAERSGTEVRAGASR